MAKQKSKAAKKAAKKKRKPAKKAARRSTRRTKRDPNPLNQRHEDLPAFIRAGYEAEGKRLEDVPYPWAKPDNK